MSQAAITREIAEEAWKAVRDIGSVKAAALQLGLNRNMLQGRYAAALQRFGFPEVRNSPKAIASLSGIGRAPDAGAIQMPELPDKEPSYEELVERSKRAFRQYKEAHDARRLVRLPVRMDGPIGILATGDPHVDAHGTNWDLIQKHTRLVRETEGLFATNVGDLANNWVGRLARLYAEQHTTPREARIKIEGFFREFGGKLLWIDCGNHDVWNGQDDLYRWLARAAGASMAWYGNRVCLEFRSGATVTVNSRHDFKGSSQWNIVHGPLKAAMMGDRDDIYTCGHLHAGGYQMLVHAGGEISHVTRLSAYKVLDTYKDENGWRDQHLPAALFIINPYATTHAAKVTFCPDPEAGAEYLTYLRRRHEQAKRIDGGGGLRAGRDEGGQGGNLHGGVGKRGERDGKDAPTKRGAPARAAAAANRQSVSRRSAGKR